MAEAVFQKSLPAMGYQQIVAATLADATALTVPAGATCALIQAEGSNLRWRDDGTSPTTSVGMVLVVGVTEPFHGDINTVEFIGDGATGILNVTYYAGP